MSKSVNIHRPQPTWNQGFARSAYESLHPKLWKGLVGAWVSGLGNTGLGTLHDVSVKNNNHATFEASMTIDDWVIDDGRQTLEFDGTDDFVSISTGLEVPQAEGTISLWWNPLEAQADGVNHMIFRARLDSPLRLFDVTTASALFFSGWHNAGNDGRTQFGTTGFSTIGQWYHLVTTWISGGNVSFYIDSDLKATDANLTAQWDTTTADRILIGGDTTGGDFAFSKIDEILIYNRVLSLSEISKLYMLGRGGIFQQKPLFLGKSPEVPIGCRYLLAPRLSTPTIGDGICWELGPFS